jgi:hypothetical protein
MTLAPLASLTRLAKFPVTSYQFKTSSQFRFELTTDNWKLTPQSFPTIRPLVLSIGISATFTRSPTSTRT